MKHQRSLLALSLIAALPACTRQDTVPRAAAVQPPTAHAAPIVTGDTVTEFDTTIRTVFQAMDDAYWFGSDGQGVYRWEGDGKPLVRFTSKHGLAGDHVCGVQQDRAGNIIVYSESGGVSMLDGRGFTRLAARDPSKCEWKLAPDDLWFPAGQDTGAVYRWDGTSLHRLMFPATAAGDAHYAAVPRSKFPNAKYSPYDVYTIFKDSKGCVWFGTAMLGACRYDGSTFAWAGTGENGSFGVRSIVEDKDGAFWLSNCVSRFVEDPHDDPHDAAEPPRYRKEPGIATGADPYSVFVSTVRDNHGVLWMATLGGGVFRYDGTTWTHFPVTHDGQPIWVNQLYLDRKNALWLGTQEHGMYRLDGAAFKKFSL